MVPEAELYWIEGEATAHEVCIKIGVSINIEVHLITTGMRMDLMGSRGSLAVCSHKQRFDDT